MKSKNISKAMIAAMSVFALASCSNDDQVLPDNPEVPKVGPEVSTSVIYQANPRFFAGTNCLDALTAQVGDIADMGVDILWVMPVQEQGEKDAFGSPYCIKDYKSVNSRYGTITDFKELVDAAHAKGMKVILDWVANHTSWDNVWISSHPEYYAKDANGNIAQASTWTDVAQLDYNNADTRSAMTDAMRYWIDQTGIDGFRCDYTDGVPHSYWSEAISSLRNSKPDLIMLAESSKTDFYNDGFDMVYDWEFAPAMSDAFNGGRVSNLFSTATSTWGRVPEGKHLLRYTFNHDFAAENSFDKSFGSTEGVMAAYVLTAMLHGTPMIYSSMDAQDNITGTLSFFNYRTMSWSAEKRAAFKAINSAYKATAEVRRGELATFTNQNVAVFTRITPNQTVLVMVNLSNKEQTVKTPIVLAGASVTDLINGTQVNLPVTQTLAPYGYTILVK